MTLNIVYTYFERCFGHMVSPVSVVLHCLFGKLFWSHGIPSVCGSTLLIWKVVLVTWYPQSLWFYITYLESCFGHMVSSVYVVLHY